MRVGAWRAGGREGGREGGMGREGGGGGREGGRREGGREGGGSSHALHRTFRALSRPSQDSSLCFSEGLLRAWLPATPNMTGGTAFAATLGLVLVAGVCSTHR